MLVSQAALPAPRCLAAGWLLGTDSLLCAIQAVCFIDRLCDASGALTCTLKPYGHPFAQREMPHQQLVFLGKGCCVVGCVPSWPLLLGSERLYILWQSRPPRNLTRVNNAVAPGVWHCTGMAGSSDAAYCCIQYAAVKLMQPQHRASPAAQPVACEILPAWAYCLQSKASNVLGGGDTTECSKWCCLYSLRNTVVLWCHKLHFIVHVSCAQSLSLGRQ